MRSDHGGENIKVWEFMEEACGPDRGSFIAGCSVHNTHIERLWRDVCTAVSATYLSISTELEEQNTLDPLNEADQFCLHHVFIPRINASLRSFQLAWNNHPLSTEGNRSPMQLYTFNSVGSALFSDHDLVDMSTYGEDSKATVFDLNDDTDVTVPNIDIPLSQSSWDTLIAIINPLQECDDGGIQLYINCVQLVYQLMHLLDE